jgi:hypothetical protein
MTPQPQPQPASIRRPLIIDKPQEVRAALSAIEGLTREILLAAAEEGERGRQNCTENHPITAPGTMAYYDAVRALRDQLLPRWTKVCDRGSELTISPSGKNAIVVASGDENVGSLKRDPRTRRKKGNSTRRAARGNLLAWQPDLFDLLTDADLAAVIERQREEASRVTHILLVHRTEEKLIVELSVVFGFDEDGHAAEWAQRIIVGELPLDRTGVAEPKPEPVEPTPDFDIVVTRRTG